MQRSKVIHAFVMLSAWMALGFALAFTQAANAQQFPAKPVRVLITFPPAGPTDIFGRMVADILSRTYNQQFVADNRGGAGGNIGTDLCAKSPPDGYTICIITVSLSIAPAVYPKLPFDPIKDFTHVTLIAKVPSVLTVHPAFPAKTVKDIIALAKARPGQLSYSSTGNGTSPHMLTEMFKSMTGIDMVHIPYRGQAPAVVDQISGQIQLAFNTAIGVMPLIHAGKLRAVAVSTKERFPAMPELPTVEEAGVKGFDGSSWHGIIMPAGVPQDIVEKIYAPVVANIRSTETRERLLRDGALPGGSTPAEFTAFIKAESAKWAKVAQFAKIKAD